MILNSGTLFLNYVLLIIFVAIYGFVRFLSYWYSSFEKLEQRMRVNLFYNAFIRLALESYLEITLSSMLNLKRPDISLSGEAASTFASFLFIVLNTLLPLMLLFFVYRHFRELFCDEFVVKFGSFYDTLKGDAILALSFHVFFLIRRYIYALTILFLPEYQGFQAMIFVFTSALNLSYILHQKPFQRSLFTCTEFFNELCVLICGYTLLCFTEW